MIVAPEWVTIRPLTWITIRSLLTPPKVQIVLNYIPGKARASLELLEPRPRFEGLVLVP